MKLVVALTFSLILSLSLACTPRSGHIKVTNTIVAAQSYTVVNRKLTAYENEQYSGIELSEGDDEGIAWLNGRSFQEGTIEFDVQGRDGFQKSFVGVAFHAQDNETYEAVYFRPFNFQAENQLRRSHGVQYIAHPEYSWRVLRTLRTDEFENEIQPSTIEATDWFHVRIEVGAEQLRVFVNDNPQPSLEVMRIRTDLIDGRIGFWVGDGADGRFANLMIEAS